MILTVTANAAVDKTLTVPNLQLGHRHRAQQGIVIPGGKGVNVARALKRLGEPVIATGLAGGRTGSHILDGMTEEGILNDFVRIRGESRTSTVVVDPTSGVQTEIYEYGPEVGEDELAMLREKLHYLSGAVSTVVLAGSLPRRVPTELYAGMISEMTRRKVRTVIDCDGEPLRKALARPARAGVDRAARGRGAGRARVPDRRGLPGRAHRDRLDGGRERPDHAAHGLLRAAARPAAPARTCTGPGSRRSSRSRRSGPARRSWPDSWRPRPPTRRPRSACGGRSPAAPRTRRPSARGSSTRATCPGSPGMVEVQEILPAGTRAAS